jgi:hypothetical protein
MMILIHAIATVAAVAVAAVDVVRKMKEQLLIPKKILMKQIPNQGMSQRQKVAMAQHIAVAVAVAQQARMSHQVKPLMKMALSQLSRFVRFGNVLLARSAQNVPSAVLVTVAREIVAEIVDAMNIASHIVVAEQLLQMENS